MDILPDSEWAFWNTSFGGSGTGSGTLSGPWYRTHKVSACLQHHVGARELPRAQGKWGHHFSLSPPSSEEPPSSTCLLLAPDPSSPCCSACTAPASPTKPSFLRRNRAELYCSLLEHCCFLSAVFLSLSVLTMYLGSCKRETEVAPEN